MSVRAHFTALFVFLCAAELILYFTICKYWPNNDLSLKRQVGQPENKFEKARVCKIPRIYPFQNSTLRMIEREIIRIRKRHKQPKCFEDPPRFVTDLKSTLTRVNESSDFWKNVTCCYTPFTASKPMAYNLFINPKICIPLKEDQVKIPEKHSNLIVKCSDINNVSNLLYEDYFHFFRLNKTFERKIQKLEDRTRKTETDHLSVLYIGIDSVSLTNFQRFLPKTQNYLMNKMGAVEFSGLNKVGRGTLENLVPTLSGCSFANRKTVNPKPNETCHLIWEKYAEKGYRTVLTEENHWMIIYEHMRENNTGNPEVHYTNLPFVRGIVGSVKSYGCFEHLFAPNIIKDRALEVATKLSGHLYYHHMWSVLTSHDTIGFVKYLDDPFYELMTGLVERKLLNNTVLIVSSDHGAVSSEYSRTAEGLIEARVPLLYFVFPDWFKKKYSTAMANLVRNSQGLTTPYDMHQTLQDILTLDRVSNEGLKLREVNEKPGELGLSLFLPIPLNRTCESAHIPDEYCICWSWTQMDNPHKDINIILAVSYTLDKINYEVDNHLNCTRLDLQKVISGKKRLDKKGNTVYEVSFEVIPSHGIFGAVLKAKNTTTGDLKFSVVGEIERQNKYGNQSSCLDKKLLEIGWIRSACFCKI